MLQLVVAKGLTTQEDIRAAVDRLESKVADNVGARITARAWTDPDFKVRQLSAAAPRSGCQAWRGLHYSRRGRVQLLCGVAGGLPCAAPHQAALAWLDSMAPSLGGGAAGLLWAGLGQPAHKTGLPLPGRAQRW